MSSRLCVVVFPLIVRMPFEYTILQSQSSSGVITRNIDMSALWDTPALEMLLKGKYKCVRDDTCRNGLNRKMPNSINPWSWLI